MPTSLRRKEESCLWKRLIREFQARTMARNEGERPKKPGDWRRRRWKRSAEEVGEVSFQVEGARVGEIASPLRGLRVSGRQGPWREGSLYFKLKGNSKYRPLSQSPCASPVPLSFSLSSPISCLLFSLATAFVPFHLLPISRAYTSPPPPPLPLPRLGYLNFSNWNCFRYPSECSRNSEKEETIKRRQG